MRELLLLALMAVSAALIYLIVAMTPVVFPPLRDRNESWPVLVQPGMVITPLEEND